jgi:anthranilate phosphoribosyltransferase
VTGELAEALRSLAEGRDLSSEQAEAAVATLLEGVAGDAAAAAFLTALRVKGETSDELAGAVRAVRARTVDRGLVVPRIGLVDTCGTGGDGARTVNVSTASALVVAACGVPVVKHGNRSASGNSGSAEVLAELGVQVEPEPDVLSLCLSRLGITFLFAPKFHPGLRPLAPVRKQLPFRTIFNLVGPLANPARPEYQLVGVAGESAARLVAGALAQLGTSRAAVVTSLDGLDEVSLGGPTRVWLVTGGEISEQCWEPIDFGLGEVSASALEVSGPAESADRITRMIGGEAGPVRQTVLANAAAALWVATGDELKACVSRAAESVDSGRTARLLEDWRRLSASRPVTPVP